MNTNDQQDEPVNTAPTNDSQPLIDLTSTLESVDQESPDAEQNATTITDNNGGRIELNQDEIVNREDSPANKK